MDLSEDSAIFFCPGTGLLSCLDPPAEGAKGPLDVEGKPLDARASDFLNQPEQKLAHAILNTANPSPRSLDFARGMVNRKARVENAAHLLWGVIAREIASDKGPELRELWEIVDAEWTSLAGSARVEEALIATAKEIGIGAPKTAAKRVLAAVKRELLPTLHAVFAAATDDVEHRLFHVQRATGAPRSTIMLSAWSVLMPSCVEEARRLARGRNHLGALRILGAIAHDGSAVSVAALSAEVGSLALCIAKDVQRHSPKETAKTLDALTATLQVAPLDPRVRTALSALHMRAAVQCIEHRQGFCEAGIHFAKAAAYDPSNQAAHAQIAECKQLLTGAKERLESALRMGKQLTWQGHELLREARRGMGQAESLLQSSWTEEQNRAYGDALLGQIAYRIGLDPSHPDAQSVVCALLAALVPGDKEGLSSANRIALLVSLRPELSGIQWSAVAARAVTKNGKIDLDELLEALPTRTVTFGDDEALGQALSTLKADSEARAAAAGKPLGRQSFAPWLFSRQDLGTKLAAAAGIALVIGGCAQYAQRSYTIHVRERAYAELQAAISADHRRDVLKAAREFVERTPSPAVDYRSPEVARVYERTLVQEMAAVATESESDEELRGLLSDARALRTWAGAEDNGSGAETAGNGRMQ